MTDGEAVDVTIREAGAEDWPAIAALQTLSWRSAYRGMVSEAYLGPPVAAERIALWRARFEEPRDPDQVVAVAERDGEVVGLACILAGRDPRWGSLIDNLHIHPEMKRSGIGRRVLAAATRLIPERHGATALHLTVLEANRAAQAAYERWGGSLAESFVDRGPGGEDVAVRRYVWASPAALMKSLGRAA